MKMIRLPGVCRLLNSLHWVSARLTIRINFCKRFFLLLQSVQSSCHREQKYNFPSWHAWTNFSSRRIKNSYSSLHILFLRSGDLMLRWELILYPVIPTYTTYASYSYMQDESSTKSYFSGPLCSNSILLFLS